MRIRLTFIDAAAVIIAVVAIVLIVAAFMDTKGPPSEVQDFTITEIPSAQAPPAFPAPHDPSI